jgi:hypothetical protein
MRDDLMLGDTPKALKRRKKLMGAGGARAALEAFDTG